MYSNGVTADLTESVIWTSSSTNVATISNSVGSNGLVTTVATGVTNISASVSGVSSAPMALTVTNATLSSIAVTPNTKTLPLGITQQYTAMGTFSDGTSLNITSSVSWSSNNTAVATISASGLATPVAAGNTNIKASVGNVTSPAVSLTVSSAALNSISVTSTTGFSSPLGVNTQLTATGNFSDGTTQDLTSQVTWSSSSTSVATVSNVAGSNGLVIPVSVGTTNITATLNATSSIAVTQTVTSATLSSIAVTPGTANTPLGVAQQYTAAGTYSDGSILNITSSVTWSSSNTNIATISNATNSSGLASPVATGSTTITATLGSDTSLGVTLTVSSATLQSIAVASTTTYSTALGVQTQFTATGMYSDGTQQDITSQVTWNSSSTAVATISNATGSNGVLTPASVGGTQITATKSGVSSNSVPFVVTAATLSSIAVTSNSNSTPLGQTMQYTAIGTYSDGTTANITSTVTWSSSNINIATISNASGSIGLATPVAVGATNITASLNGVNSTPDTLTVNNASLVSIAIDEPGNTTPMGVNTQYTATATYSDGSTADVTNSVTWSSSAGSVATVSNVSGFSGSYTRGLTTPVAVGTTDVTASLNGITSQTVTFTVTGGSLVSIAVSSPYSSTGEGVKQQFQAIGTYSDGTTANLTQSVTWDSSSTSKVTINASGLATSVAAGTSNITAQFYGVTSSSSTLTVTSATITTLTILPNTTITLPSGVKQQFTATAAYSDGTLYDLTSSVTWTSSSPNVVISNVSGSAGLATANNVSNGNTITATYLTINSAPTTVNVSAAVLQSIVIAPATVTVAKGLTKAYTATGAYSDGSSQDITNSVTWLSADTAVATINSSTGVATVAAASGTTDITASLNGITSNTAVLTASAAVLQSITITPASATVAKGLTQAYTATGTYSDNSTDNITNQVTWSSDNTGVATINASTGVATVVAASGTTNVTASSDGVTSNTAVLTASAATLQSIAITPTTATVAKGLTQAYSATGTYSDNSTEDITDSVTWSSSNTAVATINSSTGVATIVAASGSTNITAALGGKTSNTAELTASAATLVSIAITPADPTLALSTGFVQLTATGTYTDNTTGNITSNVAWSSSNTGVVSVPGVSGVAALYATGTSQITATMDGKSDSTTITVQ
ncbi:MAG: hypothetical protein EKK54_00020 [Neisseriaceae bacterium]|nr:MAG: hypothetical protein EKK54_00020 [Neisseriaceae bacterium]